MLTLNQIKYKLIDYFNNHALINQTVYADEFEFTSERQLIYPVVNIEYLDTNLSNKKMTHSFKIILGDLFDPNIKNIDDEIISDMLQIADDLFSYLQEEEGWEFTKSSSIQHFKDDFSDRVAGITFRISLSVIRTHNTCITPKRN